jgi:WD40 repeat protein
MGVDPAPPPAAGRGTLLAAVGLLVFAATFAVAGSFGAFRVLRSPTGYVEVVTGWWVDISGIEVSPEQQALQLVLDGLPVVVGGCASVLAVALLLMRPAVGRAVAVVAGGVLVGSTASIWFTLLAHVSSLRRQPAPAPSVDVGAGAWLVLVAAVLALVAVALVLGLPTAQGSPYPIHPSPGGRPPGPASVHLGGADGREGRPRALVAGVLLVAVAVLAAVGSVTALLIQTNVTTRDGSASAETRTFTSTGWTYTDSAGDVTDYSPPLIGIPLVAGAALALAAVAMLLLRLRRPDEPTRARLLGIGACGLVVGAAAVTWLDLLTAMRAAVGTGAPGIRIDTTVNLGLGAWLILLAVVGALVAVGLLVTPLRRPALPPSGAWSEPTRPIPTLAPLSSPPAVPSPRRRSRFTAAQIGTVAVAFVAVGLLMVGLLSADPDADLFPHKQEFRTGHTGDVKAVTTAELGGRPVIVSGGDDNTVRVWDLATGAPIGQPLTGHDGYVNEVAVTQLEGRPVIVSGGNDNVRVWDLATGAPIGQPLVRTGVSALAITHLDGRPVVVYGGYDSIGAVDLATGDQLGRPVTDHETSVFAVAFAELDGRPVLAAGTIDGSILVRDMATGAPVNPPIAAHPDGVLAVVSTHLDGRPVIVSGGYGGAVRMWDLATGAPVGEPIPTYDYGVYSLAITQLDDRPILVSAGSTVRVWDLATSAPIGPALTKTSNVALWAMAVAELDGGPIIVGTGGDGFIWTWGP